MKKNNLQALFWSNCLSKPTLWLILSTLFLGTACDGMVAALETAPSFPNKDKIQSAIQVSDRKRF